MYTVDLIDDCLYSWNIKLYKLVPVPVYSTHQELLTAVYLTHYSVKCVEYDQASLPPSPLPPSLPPPSLPPCRVDPDSSLSEDMKKLKETEGVDHMLLHIAFDDKFPYSPPFVRVVKPVITGGYVLAGGAICMELLTPQVRGCGSVYDVIMMSFYPLQGWSSAYTIEAVILQIGATLVKGKARIVFSQTKVRQTDKSIHWRMCKV